MTFVEFFYEYKYLTVPFAAWIAAQILKFVIALLSSRKIDFTRLVGSGGMPSSHSALAVSLASLTGFYEGTNTIAFGLAVAFALVVMYDAAGVRRATGKQAVILNKMFYHKKGEFHLEEELKELIGHTPFEVIAGAILGFSIAFLFFKI